MSNPHFVAMSACEDSQERVPSSAASSSGRVEDTGKFISENARDQALLKTIADLRQKQKEQTDAKKKITKELKNAKKRKARIVKKARELSNEDLVEVMRFRARFAGNAAEPVAAASQASKQDADDASSHEGHEGGPSA